MKLSLYSVAYLAVALAGCAPPYVAPSGSASRSGSGGGAAGAGGGGGEATGGAGGTASGRLPDGGPMLSGDTAAAPDAGAPDATPSEQMNCGLNKIDLARKPGNLLLVLDRSGSMALAVSEAQPSERWGEVVGALDEVMTKTQRSIAWGLKLYPSGSVCGVPEGATVPLAATNHDPIMAAITQNRPVIDGGATPTQDAVRKALAFLKAETTLRGLKDPTLVIATDGEPNCAGAVNPGEGSDADGAVAAVAEAKAAGIPAYVVGIATAGSDADATLNRMAEAGGRARADATKYYPVSNRDQLVQAFAAITGEIASCTFPLDRQPPVPDNVAVNLDGARLPEDSLQQQGWHYGANHESIILAGDACDKVKTSPTSSVQIIYGCPNVVIP